MSAIQGIYKYQHGGDVLLRRGLTVRVARESGLVRAGGDGTRNTDEDKGDLHAFDLYIKCRPHSVGG